MPPALHFTCAPPRLPSPLPCLLLLAFLLFLPQGMVHIALQCGQQQAGILRADPARIESLHERRTIPTLSEGHSCLRANGPSCACHQYDRPQSTILDAIAAAAAGGSILVPGFQGTLPQHYVSACSVFSRRDHKKAAEVSHCMQAQELRTVGHDGMRDCYSNGLAHM